MPPKAQQFQSLNTHKVYNQNTPIIMKTIPIKTNSIQTPSVSSGPIVIKTSNLPNSTPVLKSQKIILPASTQSTIISSDLPNTEKPKEQDNTMTYVLIGAVIIGFMILQNKDI